MSIPLVRNNTKDAINTSIIAIKKNLERINSLLGLADSSEPDLSGLATKQELEDAVTEINNTIDEVETSLQPVDTVTSGDMHSVTSNAVDNAFMQRLSAYISYNFNIPDYGKYVLFADITTWYNSTSSSVTQKATFNGLIVSNRQGGVDRSDVVLITLSVGWYRNGRALSDKSVCNVHSYSLNETLKASVIKYNDKYYLAVKTLYENYRNLYFLGFQSQSPLLQNVLQTATVEELYVD